MEAPWECFVEAMEFNSGLVPIFRFTPERAAREAAGATAAMLVQMVTINGVRNTAVGKIGLVETSRFDSGSLVAGEQRDRETLDIGSNAYVCVDAGLLHGALAESGDGTILVEIQLTRIFNEGNRKPHTHFIKIVGFEAPAPAALSISMQPDLTLNATGEDTLTAIGTLSIRLPANIKRADPRYPARFVIELEGYQGDDALHPVSLAATSDTAQALTVTHEPEYLKSRGVTAYQLELDEPRALFAEENLRVDLVLDIVQFLDIAHPASIGDRAFEVYEYGLQVDGYWIDQDQQEVGTGAWMRPDDITNVAVKVDRRKHVSIMVNEHTVRQFKHDVDDYCVFDAETLNIPAIFSEADDIPFGDIQIGFETNEDLAGTLLMVVIVTLEGAAGQELARFEHEWQTVSQMTQAHQSETYRTYINLAPCGKDIRIHDHIRDLESRRGFADIVELKCRVTYQQSAMGIENPISWFPDLEIPIQLFKEEEALPICIDVGMSATSIWVDNPIRDHHYDIDDNRSIGAIPVGSMHAMVDPNHDEFSEAHRVIDFAGNRVADDEKSYLIPSHIGLGSDHNLRARYNPLSLGMPDLSGASDASVLRRLKLLSRRYDVSVPFPNTSDLYKERKKIIFDLKRRLTLGDTKITIGETVNTLPSSDGRLTSTRIVDKIALLSDYLDELVRLYVAKHLHWNGLLNSRDPTHMRRLSNPQLILTHAIGISQNQSDFYNVAARQVLKRISKRRFGGAESATAVLKPILIPESVAAAYKVLQVMQEEGQIAQLAASGDPETIISLDIGAGTFDVSVLEVEAKSSTRFRFEVLQGFGLSVAGERLDQTIVLRVAVVLKSLFADPTVAERFGELHVDCETIIAEGGAPTHGETPRHFWFKRQIRDAKARLSSAILMTAGQQDSFAWSDPGQYMEILLYDDNPAEAIVKAEASLLRQSAGVSQEREVNNLQAFLEYRTVERENHGQTEQGSQIWLKLSSAFFGPDLWPDEDGHVRHGAIVSALGNVMPEIALDVARKLTEKNKVRVVVTGRTSLWPPLFDRIYRTIRQHEFPARLHQAFPFEADMMKTAVVTGAIGLYQTGRHKSLRPKYLNPVALVETNFMRRGNELRFRLETTRRPTNIEYLTDLAYDQADANRQPIKVNVSGDCIIARAIPMLTLERIKLLNEVGDGAPPYIQLGGPQRRISGSDGPMVHIFAKALNREHTELNISWPDNPTKTMSLLVQNDKLVSNLMPRREDRDGTQGPKKRPATGEKKPD